MHFIYLIAFLFAWEGINAQHNPLQPPNTYRSSDNPWYWKNKMPYDGYWQQDVHYTIDAYIDEQNGIIDATQKLTYWNNSPDTLKEVFFILYQEAFQPESYYHKLYEANGRKVRFGKYEADGLGTEIEKMEQNGSSLEIEQENTVLRIKLAEPILPNGSTSFDITFKTYFDYGSIRRRMKQFVHFGNKHFNGVHWYPKIAVYDQKFGWQTDQHLGREFYSDFGTFDVTLNFPANYIVEATGNLLNRKEMLPDTLRKKLDISNFKDKPWEEKPSVIIPYDSTQRKTWNFHAENVHNFAFTADPSYRIGTTYWNDIECVALVMEQHASKWQNVAQLTADVVRVYSEDFGMYAYPKMIVADAEDGMEYPMLTLCGGSDPGNRGLIAHEVGHNWFYGMIGSNETYRAALDEGFTQFLTAWALERIDGKYRKHYPYEGYEARFKDSIENREARVYYGYLADAIRHQDAHLNTHSDGFHGAIRHGGGYRHVYYKTATMLYNLQYVLGDSLFQKAIKYNVAKWSMAHPYFKDMRQAFKDGSGGVDLNWFFDQWLETDKRVDYAIKKVKKTGKTDSGYSYDITIKRKERQQQPIDLLLTTKEGDSVSYYIPNTWFEKETDATTLDRWIGWDKLQKTYTAEVELPGKLKNVIIDPSYRLADIYRPDNSKRGKVDFGLDGFVREWLPNRKKYTMRMRPDLWWNAYDGIKVGVVLSGDYMRYKHKFELGIWGSTGLLQGSKSRFNYPEGSTKKFDKFNYRFKYSTGLNKYIRGGEVSIWAQCLEGLRAFEVKFGQNFSKNVHYAFSVKLLTRSQAEKINYLLYPNEWIAEKINNSFNLELGYKYKSGKVKGDLTLYIRSSALFSDFDYHYAAFESKQETDIWRFELRSRLYGRIGTGSNPAPESMLFAAAANNEEMINNAFTRSQGFVPPSWVGYGAVTNSFHAGGGLNLRGYANYLITEEHNGNAYLAYKGQSGAAINLELDFDNIIKWRPKRWSKYIHIDTYIFADGGILHYDAGGEKSFGSPRMDAGAGTVLTIKRFGPLETIKPLSIRFDVPFYLSHAPFLEDNIKFRFVVGVMRSF